MKDPKPDGILKAWKAMDEATEALREAARKCYAASMAINDTTSEAKGELQRLWAARAHTVSNIIGEITGK